MNQYTIYCTEEQTRKALELGASIETKGIYPPVVNINNTLYFVPTAEQMIGWLEEQGIRSIDITTYGYTIWLTEKEYITEKYITRNRKEATLAAIDAALEYLTSKK